MSTTTNDPSAASERQGWRVSLIGALALAFGSLALISGIAYFAVLAGATGTTERLLVDRAGRVIEAQVSMVRSHLDPVTEQLELVAALAADGRIDISSRVAVRETLAVMVAKTSPVSIAAFAGLDLEVDRAIRLPDGAIMRDTIPITKLPGTLRRFRELETQHKTFWGDLFWSSTLQQPVLNVRTPVRRSDNAFIGALVATVGVGDLSQLIDDPVQTGGGGYFILVGHDQVLAHRRLIHPQGLGLSEAKPLPTITEVGDPVLAHIWDKPATSSSIERALGGFANIVSVDGRRWVFVQRELRGYGPDPWIVGQYFPLEEATSELDRLTNGAIVGGITLLFAALLALLMGLRMARSIRTITTAAEAIERLEFEQPMHRPSRLREIDDAGRSLEKARSALKWFGVYVPHRLVQRLMERGEAGVASRRVKATIMFTDIVEFTPHAESLPEHETADLLNHHFALLGACIEHEHGVIDKYIGDSVMAVWGGVSAAEDHADHAIRAALAIARVIKEDNVQRRAEGKPPIRVRIGLHSGPVVVGNIGAPGRVNFTVVGDTVNIAQRFEQLGKEFLVPGEEVVVLTSGETLAAVKDRDSLGIDLPPPQRWGLRGHEQPVDVYRLV
ncbi:adenylate/guanylate cyclase domain-containing protein [Enhydrobacter aerosaccus]|uniref:adenylate/guanylate cyclase domain-containing protein n=1 Tax=Enhydrobacter aerosaccus TaxID=225324 RepID=UPI000A2F8601|nr:adenylate/guanylate cyclase domain-containing protein [Enhydrobacter aerosaccus]